MSSEFRNPAKDVPRSMILSLVTCGGNLWNHRVVMNGLMPYAQLAKESAALAAAARDIYFQRRIDYSDGRDFCCSPQTLNGLMMSGSRMIYAMERKVLCLRCLESKSKERHARDCL